MQRLLQVTHVRSLHTTGFGEQQQALAAAETVPAPFSVFRTQQNDPVSKSLTGQNLSMTLQNTIHLPVDATLVFGHCLLIGLSLQAFQSEKHIGQYYTVPPAHFHSLFPLGLPRRYQRQVCFLIMRAYAAFKTFDIDFHIRFLSVNKKSHH